MFKRVEFSVCVLVLVGLGVCAASEQIHVGAGSQSCGQWVEARRGEGTGDLVRRSAIVSWVQGYLVGTAEGVTGEKSVPEIAERIAQGELPPDLDLVFSDLQGRLLAILQAKFGTRSGWVFDPPDPDAIRAWLDKYCREHPLDPVERATIVLVDSLYSRGRAGRTRAAEAQRSVGFPSAAWAQELVVDWSDHPRDAEFAADAVFQRNLVCWNSGPRDVCQLTVVTIDRHSCPALVTAASWRTDTGDLKISRTSTAVDLEFEDVSLAGPTHWTLHLKLQLRNGDQFIVDQASGVVVTRPLVPGDRIRSTELIPIVKGTKGLDKFREWADIDLKCPRIAVVAAKK